MFRVVKYDVLPSTNEAIKEAIEAGEAEGLVYRANRQTNGYGRQGRSWSSPAGGMYESVLLRPEAPLAQWPTLGLVVGLGIRDAVIAVGGLDPRSVSVKWPNDVMVDEGKIAGISCEAKAGALCVGIGVNVFRKEGWTPFSAIYEPKFLSEISGAALDTTIDQGRFIDLVGNEVLAHVERRYESWKENGFAECLVEFNGCSYLNGRHVRVSTIHGIELAEGFAQGVDGSGNLLVDTDEGIKVLSSGEAHISGYLA